MEYSGIIGPRESRGHVFRMLRGLCRSELLLAQLHAASGAREEALAAAERARAGAASCGDVEAEEEAMNFIDAWTKCFGKWFHAVF